jgi:hypothetical protein
LPTKLDSALSLGFALCRNATTYDGTGGHLILPTVFLTTPDLEPTDRNFAERPFLDGEVLSNASNVELHGDGFTLFADLQIPTGDTSSESARPLALLCVVAMLCTQ